MTCGLPCPTCIPPGTTVRRGALGTCDRGLHLEPLHSHLFYDDSPDVKSVVEHKWQELTSNR